MRGLGFILSTLLALAGCGQTTENTPQSAAASPLVTCEGALPPGELVELSAASTNVSMGPCGELSYTEGEQVFLTDSSLSPGQLLDGATLPPIFDPHGHGILYSRDQESTLVYRELRGENSWAVPLPALSDEDTLYDIPGQPARIIDFYSNAGQGVPFHCQGTTVYDYDSAGNETAHELDILCPRALHSGLDALLVGPGDGGYQSVTLGSWQTRQLEGVGTCESEMCERSMTRRVLKKQLLVSQLMGDAWWPVPAGAKFYDGETGKEVSYTALSTPDRGVVAVPGSDLYVAEDLTLAVTDDSTDSVDKTVLRYFGPNPARPERWLTSSITLEPRRAGLHALPSQDLERVAVWSDACNAQFGRTLLTFAPGHAANVLDIPACALWVHWVGNDGTLLAQVWPDGTEWLSIYQASLALIYPDNRFEMLDIPIDSFHGVSRVLSNERTLIVDTGPLFAVDIETATAREIAPAVDLLFTDAARQRLAFVAPSSAGSVGRPLWAGAFPP